MSTKNETVKVYNRSKQMIPLQVREPKGDFYISERQIQLMPGKEVLLPASHVMRDQLDNLRSRGMLAITYND